MFINIYAQIHTHTHQMVFILLLLGWVLLQVVQHPTKWAFFYVRLKSFLSSSRLYRMQRTWQNLFLPNDFLAFTCPKKAYRLQTDNWISWILVIFVPGLDSRRTVSLTMLSGSWFHRVPSVYNTSSFMGNSAFWPRNNLPEIFHFNLSQI